MAKIEWVTAIFVGQGMTKSHCLHIFKCQYLIEILRYGANFLHVIITFIGFKITFSNIRSHGAPLLISRGWRLAPPPGLLTIQNTLGLIGLRYRFRDQMQKFGLLSWKLTEISRFKNLVKLRFHVTSVYKNCHNSLNFEATGLIFCMQAWFW